MVGRCFNTNQSRNHYKSLEHASSVQNQTEQCTHHTIAFTTSEAHQNEKEEEKTAHNE